MTAVLISHTLCKRFGPSEPWSVHALDLRLDAGRVLAVLGPPGAGKTTLVRLVAGLTEPDDGEILVFGLPPASPEAQSRLGLVPEAPSFPPLLRPAEVMDYCGRLLRLAEPERSRRSHEALEWAGLAEEWRQSSRLPLGRRKRLGIAQALLGRPDLLVLDEPGAGLDKPERLALRQLVRALARSGASVLICSRERGEVEEACDEAILLDAGRELASGALQQVVPPGWSLERAVAEVRECRRLAEQTIGSDAPLAESAGLAVPG